MTFSKYLQETRPLFLSLQILNIYELNTYLMALLMHSYFSGHLPNLFTIFQKIVQFISITLDLQTTYSIYDLQKYNTIGNSPLSI